MQLAGWIVGLLLVPFIGMLAYLIARGGGMRERMIKEQADRRKHMEAHFRGSAVSRAGELARLSELKDNGAISDAEFDREKEKLLG